MDIDPLYNKPSAASSSLLSSLVDDGSGNLMQFSRPSAWSDLLFTSDNNHRDFKKLVFKVTYDYTKPNYNNTFAPVNFVCEPSMVNPTIIPDIKDLNGRQAGRGQFYRFYDLNELVNIKMENEIGMWTFDHLENSNGESIDFSIDADGFVNYSIVINEVMSVKAFWHNPDTLNIVYPTGGEKLFTNTEYEILWKDNVFSPMEVVLLKDGFTQAIISDTTDEESFAWSIPKNLTLGDNYQIVVKNMYDESIRAISQPFSITDSSSVSEGDDGKYIRILSPNQPLVYYYNAVCPINIEHNLEGNVHIKLLKNATEYKVLYHNSSETSFNWTIDYTIIKGDEYQIKVISCDNPDLYTLSSVFSIAQPLGVNDSLASNQIAVYPNPARENIKIQFNSENKEYATFSIYNVQGQIVINRKLSAFEENTIEVSNLKQGIYFIKSNELNYCEKLIVK